MTFKRQLISNGNPFEEIIGFSRAVKVGPYITVGGTAPVDEKGNTVGIGDPALQAEQCIKIIQNALEQAGSGLEDVVRTRILLTNIEDWTKVVEVRAKYFKTIRPVDTVMQVGGFINPDWRVEIEADAIIQDYSDP